MPIPSKPVPGRSIDVATVDAVDAGRTPVVGASNAARPSAPERIEAHGLLLRRWTSADVPAFVAAVHESVATVGAWMSWCHAGYRDDDAHAWFAACDASRDDGSAYEYGVFDAADGALVGGAGLNLLNGPHRFCNLGYWVRASRQREGFAHEAARILTRVAFDVLALERVEIVVAVGNVASEGVARKVGAVAECVSRNRIVVDGRSSPATMFSLVPGDLA